MHAHGDLITSRVFFFRPGWSEVLDDNSLLMDTIIITVNILALNILTVLSSAVSETKELYQLMNQLLDKYSSAAAAAER